MAQGNTVMVYRFWREESGAMISPQHMWGTVEAIAMLPECTPIMDTAREVHVKLLDNGFYFEHSPTLYQEIESR